MRLLDTALRSLSAALCFWLAQPAQTSQRVRFESSGATVDCYDFVELIARVHTPKAANPFTDAALTGTFSRGSEPAIPIEGFCDSADGSVYRIRFMPAKPGEHAFKLNFRDPAGEVTFSGKFDARDARRKGIVRVDPEFPWRFQWDGTKERYFYNGTTTYWLAGWDPDTITQTIDRLDRHKITRVRAALSGRVKDGHAWFEPVYPSAKFSFLLNPWVAKSPDSIDKPEFDVRRFNVDFWRKYEHILREARARDMVVSVIFYVDGRRPGVDPFGKAGMGGEDEQRFYRYAIARFSAFGNVMWDLANEYRLFRDDAWAEKMGLLVKQWDPYHHLVSTHGHGDFRFRKSSWADFAMFQSWDEHGGWNYMVKNFEEQMKTGRMIPQVNEEYGYEDHYPEGWGGNRKAPTRSAATRLRIAWEICLAGGYQTTGERANAGGGWINGFGTDEMTMLEGYGHLYDFFTSLTYWKLRPDPALVVRTMSKTQSTALPPGSPSAMAARSDKGDLAVIYISAGNTVTLKSGVLQDGLRPLWFSPANGGVRVARARAPLTYQGPTNDDWVLILSVPCNCSFREHDEEFEK